MEGLKEDDGDDGFDGEKGIKDGGRMRADDEGEKDRLTARTESVDGGGVGGCSAGRTLT
jgi:hypothetical protein